MPQIDTDILIVGGGPAGLTAGIRARQLGFDATIFEPKKPPIDKACGEGLMPEAIELLEELGIDVESLPGFEFRGVRYCHARRTDCSAYGEFTSRRGKGVRRYHLHRRMHQKAIEQGVNIRCESVESIQVRSDDVAANGLTGRWLVGADGLHSNVRRKLNIEVQRGRRDRFGVRRHFRLSPWSDFVEVYWGEAGEAYVTPVGPEQIGVAILAEGGGRFEELLPAFPILQQRLQGVSPITEIKGAGPFHQQSNRVVDQRALLVGDAAGYIDALTGEGVALAVKTATAAIEAVARNTPQTYARNYRRLTREYRWLTRILVNVSSWPFIHRPLIEILNRFPSVFDLALKLLGESKGNFRRH